MNYFDRDYSDVQFLAPCLMKKRPSDVTENIVSQPKVLTKIFDHFSC